MEKALLLEALRDRAAVWRAAGYAVDFGGPRPTELVDTICARVDAHVPTELRAIWQELGWIHVAPGLGLPGASASPGSDPRDQTDILAVHAWLGSIRPTGSIVVGLEAEEWLAPGGAYPYLLLPDGAVQILDSAAGALSPYSPTLEAYLLTELLGAP